MSVFILIAIFAVLFLFAFVMGRRFGALGLGLAAGVLLAQYGAPLFAEIFAQYDQYFGDFTALAVSQMALTILPSFVLLLAGPKYHSKFRKLVGSLLYAAMATVLLFPYVSTGLKFDANLVETIASYQTYIVVAGIILAIFDMMFTHTKKSIPDKKH